MNPILICSIFILLNVFLFFFKNRISSIVSIVDKPDNKKKTHKYDAHVIGGTIIFLNLLLLFVIFIFTQQETVFDPKYFNSAKSIISFFFISFGIYMLGIYDDKFDLSPNIKLFATSFIFLIAIKIDPTLQIQKINFSFTDKVFYIDEFSSLFTLFCFLIFLNAFNMFDGINLQICTYAIFLFLIFVLNNFLIYISIIFIISLINYYALNIKGKNFLGDGGNYMLSYIVAYMFIKSYNLDNLFSSDEIFLIMFIPGVDLLRCTIIRLFRGKHPFKGDREHLHFLSMEKIGYLKTYIVIQLLIIVPYLFSKFLLTNLLSIFVSLILYTSFLFYLSKSRPQGT